MAAKPRLVAINDTPQRPTANQVRGWVEAGLPRAEIDVLITPEIAAVLLEHNRPGETNRKISKNYLKMAERSLRRNEWVNTGEPIIVSDTRLLNDGQHRLEMVVQTGLPIVADLRFGVAREAFSATNSGRKRTGGDAMLLQNARYPIRVASALRMVLAYEEGLPAGLFHSIANSELAAGLARWPDIIEGVEASISLGTGFQNSIIYSLMFFARRTANEAAVEAFFDVVRTGEGAASNPPHRLREYVLRNAISQHKERRTRAMAMAILAWNAWNRGERSVGPINWRLPAAFPQVEKLKL